MLKISSLLFSIIAISSSIILFSANSPSLSSIYAQDTQYSNNNNINENNNSSLLINELEYIENILESKVTKLVTALQIASSLPQILQPPDVNLIDPKVKGIPEDADIEKRKIGKILLDQFEFSSIDFLLNNGDVYFDEPFEDQLNRTVTNLSFRDYYQAVEQTKNTYLSDAIISKTTGRNLAVIATPVINKENNMTGILLGTINFNNYDKFLQSLNLQNNTRLVLIDKNGVKIGDSNEKETSASKESFEKKQFSNLTSFKLALKGKSGSIVEKFEGKESQITFLPYDLFQNKRILLLVQGCDSDEGNESNKCIDNDNNKELHLFNENVLTRLGSFF
jgi:hypothetical protein